MLPFPSVKTCFHLFEEYANADFNAEDVIWKRIRLLRNVCSLAGKLSSLKWKWYITLYILRKWWRKNFFLGVNLEKALHPFVQQFDMHCLQIVQWNSSLSKLPAYRILKHGSVACTINILSQITAEVCTFSCDNMNFTANSVSSSTHRVTDCPILLFRLSVLYFKAVGLWSIRWYWFWQLID